jgi:hypothetical protein
MFGEPGRGIFGVVPLFGLDDRQQLSAYVLEFLIKGPLEYFPIKYDRKILLTL